MKDQKTPNNQKSLIRLGISVLILIGTSFSAYAQTISGRILSTSGEPLPFATVYEEGTTNGTTSNTDGYYKLTLSNPTGKIVCQYIGYTRMVEAPTGATLNFTLEPQALVLNEVVISAKAKDPAHYIIRQAMRKRQFYENELDAFSCDVYIKGLQRLDKKPKSLLGITLSIDTGIIYLSESISKYKFQRPDKVSETMIASKYSGENNGFSYNRASEMLINFYQTSFFIEGLSERSFISPIGPSAFLTYDFKLVGTYQEDTLIINKIQITPKRKNDPAFQGYIYIQENTWRIHSADVMLVKDNGIDFIDSLKIFQVFAPTDKNKDIWMPLSQKFSFVYRLYGFAGSGVFNGVYSNYKVTPNPKYHKPAPQPPVVAEEKVAAKSPGKPKESKPKKEFTNAIMTIEEGANEKDSIFWKSIRPIPLTPIEVRDYQVKDSIRVIRESKAYKDSVDVKRNKFKPGNLFAAGYTYHSSFKERYYTFPNLLQLVQYNTVEGFVPELSMSVTQNHDDRTVYRINSAARYGFSNRKFQSQVEGYYVLNNKYDHIIYGGLGRYVFQYNSLKAIPEFANTFNTLALGENYIKLYQKAFTYIGYSKEVANGLRLQAKFEYAHRVQLDNTNLTTYGSKKNFTENQPANFEVVSTSFTPNNAALLSVKLRYTPMEKYIDRPYEKFRMGSKYPTFELVYKKGIPGISDVNFDYLELGVIKKFNWKLYGESDIHVVGGTFLNTSSMTFVDFQHFHGNQIFIRQTKGGRHFQLLDYYTYSTKDQFIEGHFEHHFNGFILNKIPLINKLKWQSVFSLNYLDTPYLNGYTELGVGIEHIFRFFRVDYYTAFNTTGRTQGFRIGAGF